MQWEYVTLTSTCRSLDMASEEIISSLPTRQMKHMTWYWLWPRSSSPRTSAFKICVSWEHMDIKSKQGVAVYKISMSCGSVFKRHAWPQRTTPCHSRTQWRLQFLQDRHITNADYSTDVSFASQSKRSNVFLFSTTTWILAQSPKIALNKVHFFQIQSLLCKSHWNSYYE